MQAVIEIEIFSLVSTRQRLLGRNGPPRKATDGMTSPTPGARARSVMRGWCCSQVADCFNVYCSPQPKKLRNFRLTQHTNACTVTCRPRLADSRHRLTHSMQYSVDPITPTIGPGSYNTAEFWGAILDKIATSRRRPQNSAGCPPGRGHPERPHSFLCQEHGRVSTCRLVH